MQMISCKKTSNGAHLENNIIINKIIYSRIHLKNLSTFSISHQSGENKRNVIFLKNGKRRACIRFLSSPGKKIEECFLGTFPH